MRGTMLTVFAILLVTSQAGSETPAPPDRDTGMAKDLQTLRKTVGLPGKPQASSPEAIQAAARVFERVQFVGMSKEAVLWMLGDPQTISDYGKKKGPGENDPLFYRFDHGYGGAEYKIEFKDGKVIKVEKGGLY